MAKTWPLWVWWLGSGFRILLWWISIKSSPSYYLHSLDYKRISSPVLLICTLLPAKTVACSKCSKGTYSTDLKVNRVDSRQATALPVTIPFKTTPSYCPQIITTPFPFQRLWRLGGWPWPQNNSPRALLHVANWHLFTDDPRLCNAPHYPKISCIKMQPESRK